MKDCRIIVISDTHGRFNALYNIVQKRIDEADCFIHLGDGYQEIDDIKMLYPRLKLYSVRGNCDYAPSTPSLNQLDIAGKRILYTHGHEHGVKYSLSPLINTARNIDADILLYGHTHKGHIQYDDGLYIMNPGSPVRPRDSRASYGVIDITKGGIMTYLVYV